MASASTRLALETFRMWTRYFRFETEGFDVLARAQPSLVVGYHGGPWTFDLWMLGVRMYDELGYFPRAFWHRAWWRVPGLREAVTELGGMPGPPADADIAQVKARGEHLVMAPGGTREALRPFWRQHRVDFGARRGYVRLAQAHGLQVIPVVASGLDRTFLGLTEAFGRAEVPAWLGVGLGGFWPLALPFPVKIRQRIGAPIGATGRAPEDVHRDVTETMQSMLDEL